MSAPKRLMDDASLGDDLRAGLRAAKATPPVDYDERAGLTRLTAAIGAVGVGGAVGGATAAHAVTTTAKVGLSLKAILVGTAVVGVAAGSIGIAMRMRGPADAPRPPAMQMEAPSPPRAEAPRAAPLRPEPEPVEAPSAEPPATAAPSAPSEKTAASPAASAAKPSLQAEMDQLGEIRRAQGSDPARALALANEGQARFPNGVFWQERELAAIMALRRLGRADEARTRADAFLARHPESPFAEVLRGSAP